jgi:hypothetical protein
MRAILSPSHGGPEIHVRNFETALRTTVAIPFRDIQPRPLCAQPMVEQYPAQYVRSQHGVTAVTPKLCDEPSALEFQGEERHLKNG